MARDVSSELSTRWSMLDRLDKTDANEAWEWFIHRYRPFARGVLSKTLSMRGRAGDLNAAVDEFWAYLYSSNVFRKANRDLRFRKFLAGTLRNFARDYCRRNAGGPALNVDPEQDPAADESLPEDVELKLFAHQVLHLALQHLEASHKDNANAIRWFYGVGQDPIELETMTAPLSVTEIAERLAIKPNAVHQLLFRGRKRLRARIESEVRETVSDSGELAQEIDEILDALKADAPGLTTS